jgi:hypothetical protein
MQQGVQVGKLGELKFFVRVNPLAVRRFFAKAARLVRFAETLGRAGGGRSGGRRFGEGNGAFIPKFIQHGVQVGPEVGPSPAGHVARFYNLGEFNDIIIWHVNFRSGVTRGRRSWNNC